MSYGKVHDIFWDDVDIESVGDQAVLLALFLLTGPHRNAIGCFRLGKGAILDHPRFAGWGIEGVSKALLELSEIGFFDRDDASGWTLLSHVLRHDPIKGEKAAIHALTLVARVPRHSPVYSAVFRQLEPQLKEYGKALKGKPGWPLAAPSEGYAIPHPIPHGMPKPSPNHNHNPNHNPKRFTQEEGSSEVVEHSDGEVPS